MTNKRAPNYGARVVYREWNDVDGRSTSPCVVADAPSTTCITPLSADATQEPDALEGQDAWSEEQEHRDGEQ